MAARRDTRWIAREIGPGVVDPRPSSRFARAFGGLAARGDAAPVRTSRAGGLGALIRRSPCSTGRSAPRALESRDRRADKRIGRSGMFVTIDTTRLGRRSRARLTAEGGFTLIETLVASALGIVVLSALLYALVSIPRRRAFATPPSPRRAPSTAAETPRTTSTRRAWRPRPDRSPRPWTPTPGRRPPPHRRPPAASPSSRGLHMVRTCIRRIPRAQAA